LNAAQIIFVKCDSNAEQRAQYEHKGLISAVIRRMHAIRHQKQNPVVLFARLGRRQFFDRLRHTHVSISKQRALFLSAEIRSTSD
jgi:hypothetical protein